MTTGPNQILIKRSDTAGNVPSGLSYGEPAVNAADGVIFFNERKSGVLGQELWGFHGSTGERFVATVNGATGAVTVVSSVNGATGAVTVVSSVNGATGAVAAVSSINGATGAVAAVSSFNGLTGTVTTSGQVLHVTGICADGGITVGGNLRVIGDLLLDQDITHIGDANTSIVYGTDEIKILAGSGDPSFKAGANFRVDIGDIDEANDGARIILNDSNEVANIIGTTVKLISNTVEVGQDIVHAGDANTKITFAADDIAMQAGGTTFLQSDTTGVLDAPVGITTAGLTVGATIHAGGTISSDNDVVIGNGHDLIFDGSSSSSIIQNGNEVVFFDNNNGVVRIPIFSLGVSQILSHNDDSNTRMQFLTDNIKVEAGGNVGLDMNGTNTTIDGVTFDSGVIKTSGNLSAAGGTFSSYLTVGSTLTVDTDIDFAITSEDAVIRQGGNAQIRFNNSNGYVKVLANALQVPTKITHTDDADTYVHFKTNQVLINAGGNTAMDANATNTTIDGVTFDSGVITTSGNLTVAGTAQLEGLTLGSGGITVGGNSNFLDNDVSRPNLKDYSEHVNAIGTITGNTAISFADGNVQTVTGNGNCEFSFTNPPASGKAGTLTLIITNGGANTTTFASPVKWPSDVVPSLTSSGVDILSFVTTDAGSNIFGFVGGLNFS